MPTTSYRRALRRSAVALLVVPLMGVLSPVAASSNLDPGPSGSLSVSRAPAIPGERITLSGSLPTAPSRTVVLQSKRLTNWVKVAGTSTSGTGGFRFVVTARPTSTQYRVYAPALSVSGTTQPAAVSPVRTVQVQGQSTDLTLASGAVVGSTTSAVAAFTPIRVGRPVQLQRRVGESWQVTARLPQDGAGRAVFAVELPNPGTRTYRVVAPQWQGIPAMTSALREVVVSAPVDDPPPTDEPVANLGLSAVVTASSHQTGFEPAQVVAPGVVDPNRGWRSSAETSGAWIELNWSSPQLLRRVELQRPGLAGPGIVSGFLTFGDGSVLQVRLSETSTTTAVPFSERTVRRVRFTVTSTSQGGTTAALTHMHVDGQLRSNPAENVSTVAPADGDVAAAATLTSSAAWVQLDWAQPRELTTVAVAAAAAGSADALPSGTLQFSDGSRLRLGAVLPDPSRPTVLSFMPRVTTSVRLTYDPGPVAALELSTYQLHAPAQTVAGGAEQAYTDIPVDCGRPPGRPSDATGLVVLCPTNGALVGNQAALRVAVGPSYTSLSATVWSSNAGTPASATQVAAAAADGTVSVNLDLSALPPGPFTVQLIATGPQAPAKRMFFQLKKTGTPPRAPASAPGAAAGRSLVFAEEFRQPVSTSRTGVGADYASSKPERTYGADFGSAIMADPASGLGNLRVVDNDYLKLSVQPRPAGFADPQGWGREHVGAMLSSARPGGSGFSAQYGYFEARMLTPAGLGTWPAFWMLPTPNLVVDGSVVAEIDAVELYGEFPTGACHTTHQYPDPNAVGVARCGTRWSSEQQAMSWHTYGVSVGPTEITFFIDGVQVATAPQVQGGDEPMLFMVNLALGGGWPIDLAATQNRADMYVDYIRVYA